MSAPTLTGFSASLVFDENTVNTTPQLLDADVTFADAEGNFDGGTLSVTGLLAEDRLSVANQGMGAGQIGLSGASVTFGGVEIGTLSGGAGTALAITFNGAATSAAVDALIQNLTYANVSNTPTASRDLTLNVTDAAGESLGVAAPSFVALADGDSPFGFIRDDDGVLSPAFADIDGDGDLDMVFGTNYGRIRAYQNDGAGNGFTELTGPNNPFFDADTTYRATPTFVDLDGDGDLDLVAGSSEGDLFVFDNNDGDTGFTELVAAGNPFAGVTFDYGSTPTFADLDGDGDQDMVVGASGGTLAVYDNNDGNAGFTQLTGTANPFYGIDVVANAASALADLDGDGDLDLVVGSYFQGLQVFDNNDADGGYTELTGSANPFGAIAFSSRIMPTFADVDGDGDLDLVAARDGQYIAMFENTSSPTPMITVNVTAEADLPTLTGLAASVTFGENAVNAAPQLLDGDVSFDYAGVANLAGGTLTVSGLLAEDRVSLLHVGGGAGEVGLLGNVVTYGGNLIGTLTGGVGNTMTITLSSFATPEAIEALLESLTYANTSDTPTTSRDLTVNVTDADGNGLGGVPAMGPFVQLTGAANPLNGLDSGNYSAPVFGDLDGDGDLDFLSGNGNGTLFLFDNNDGNNGFTLRTGVANPFNGIDTGSSSLPELVDVDGDGDLDLVVGSSLNGLRLFDNNDADGGYTELTGTNNSLRAVNANGASFGRYSTAAFADIDGDGVLDIVGGDFNGQLRFYTTTTTGGDYVEQTGANNPFTGIDVVDNSDPTFADLDGDGDLDLVVGARSGGLRVYDNNDGDAGFTALTGSNNPFTGVVSGSYLSPAFVDMDGDGDLDLVVGLSNGTFAVYENTAPRGQVITVVVTPEADVISGTTGNDSLDGTTADDSITALAGNDTVAGSLGLDTMDGGAGIDWLDYRASSAAVAVDLGTLAVAGGDATGDVISGFENLRGSNHNDTLTGDVGGNIIRGGLGGDSLNGGAGIDWLDYRGSGAAVRVNLATAAVSGGHADGDVIAGFENIFGSGYADTLVGDAASNVIRGGGGADTLNGGAGNDWLDYGGSLAGVTVSLATGRGLGGDAQGDRVSNFENIFGSNLGDSLTGNAGGNIIRGGGGADTLDGGAGADWLDYRGSVTGVVVNLETGTTSGGHAEDDMITGFEYIFGSAHSDILTGDGGTNVIRGGAGADALTGGAGLDWLDYRGSTAGVSVDLGSGAASGGDADGDRFVGFERIFGSGFGDTLAGDSAVNIFTGGAGADTFVFNTALGGGNIDQITDFNVADDTLHLDDAMFAGLVGGEFLFDEFRANGTGLAQTVADRIIYETDTGRLYFDADGSGATARVHFATLSASLSLTSADFFVV